MKKSIIIMMICLLFLGGCGTYNGNGNKETDDTPETTIIRLALGSSGHILNSIAESQGYLRDEGITVEYVHVNTDAEVFEGIRKGTIDVASNSGTNLPLEEISSGLDLTIFAGYLLTGCMPVFTKADTEWNGIEDLIGRTMACEPNMYAITGPLLDMGYDPVRQINWYETEDQADRITAVKNGDADFALVGTGFNYDVINDPELKIVTYADDILPEYSCCRVEALTSWVNANPNTVKALLRAWIRAMEYYTRHHDEAITLTARQLNCAEEVVSAYINDPRFDLNTGPMKKAVERAWNYLSRLGLLNYSSSNMDIDEHINTELYREALDKCQERYGSENPAFYEKLQAQYARNN